MMLQLTAVIALFVDLPAQELTGWIERGWVRPESAESGWVFQEIDVARVRLIHDLRRGMDVGEDAIPMVLSLLDQVYDLRARLKAVLNAVEAQPDEVRRAVGDYLSRSSGRGEGDRAGTRQVDRVGTRQMSARARLIPGARRRHARD